jgi:DNA topoisomerase-2
MRSTEDPIITKSVLKCGYTSIKWEWDLKWFKIQNGLSEDILALFAMYVFNAAMVTGLNVHLNGDKLDNKLNCYFNHFADEPKDSSSVLKLESPNSKVFVTASPNHEFEAISFVNGIETRNGGKHVTAWVEAVCRPIIDKLSKNDTKSLTLKDIKPYFRFLVVSRVSNPEFEGQEKNELKAPTIKADKISSYQLSKITKWPIWNQLYELSNNKGEQKLKVKSESILNIKEYSKAHNAGGVYSKNCILIVCEGLSAKTFAVQGISNGFGGKKGAEWFGIYPLRGKLLNTRNASVKSIKENSIILNLMTILGLKRESPENFDKLKYGKICILTDADVDGIHIEGLLLNFFHSMFPKLIDIGFVISMKTPILRVTANNSVQYLYDERTLSVFPKDVKIKYFKGLGTNAPSDIPHVFGKKILQFTNDEHSNDSFKIAFDQSESQNRKKWLENYDPTKHTSSTLDDEASDGRPISFSTTRQLNCELIKFFHDDCKRSIPSVFDGMKESQRKILFAAKKRNLTSDIKVAQFGAYVAEHTNYHHGEENLFKTIIKMAQSFPGSNNLPLFTEGGQFGSRISGGKDAAKPRYIFTKIRSYFSLIFNPADDPLLTHRNDDGDLVEPYYYIATIPMILVNGCTGIGTGWMCNIPQFNPTDIIHASRLWIDNAMDPCPNKRNEFKLYIDSLKPWYRGFSGNVSRIAPNKFQVEGIFSRTNNIIKISELPVGSSTGWTDLLKMKEDLGEMEGFGLVKDIKIDDSSLKTEFKVSAGFNHEKFEKSMKVTVNLDNIVVFDENDKIVKLLSVSDVFDMWGKERLRVNELRKAWQLKQIAMSIKVTSYKIIFIELVRYKELDLTCDEASICSILSNRLSSKSVTVWDLHQLQGPSTEDLKMLLDMPVRTLTKEKCNDLKKHKTKHINEYENLKNKSIYQIWNDDMNKLETAIRDLK